MKFKFKITCPVCGGPMIVRSFDNSLVCLERENHPNNLLVFRLFGDQDIIYEIIKVKEES